MSKQIEAADRAELGRAAMKAGSPDHDHRYIKDNAITTIANVLHAYGESWGGRIGDVLAEDVFDQALRSYKGQS